MKVNIYAIYDSKVGAYLQPWFAPNHAVAFRNLGKACTAPNSPFADFPADFTLFCIGNFDDETGYCESGTAHENLGNFLQFLPDDSVPDSELSPPMSVVASNA